MPSLTALPTAVPVVKPVLQFTCHFTLTLSISICNWQNVPGTHHASEHGGSSDLTVKMLV